jgi:hypothetical protein
MSEAKTTTNHTTIQQWIEERGGQPASVVGTGTDDDPGILRVDFPPDDERLEEVDWEGFFQKFDEEKLAFLYQEETRDGETSRFCKFIRKPR